MTERIEAKVGRVHNREPLTEDHMRFIQVVVIDGRGLMAGKDIIGTSIHMMKTWRTQLYDIFDVNSEQQLALALVHNGIIVTTD